MQYPLIISTPKSVSKQLTLWPAECECRVWEVDRFAPLGRCGLCGTRPEPLSAGAAAAVAERLTHEAEGEHDHEQDKDDEARRADEEDGVHQLRLPHVEPA